VEDVRTFKQKGNILMGQRTPELGAKALCRAKRRKIRFQESSWTEACVWIMWRLYYSTVLLLSWVMAQNAKTMRTGQDWELLLFCNFRGKNDVRIWQPRTIGAERRGNWAWASPSLPPDFTPANWVCRSIVGLFRRTMPFDGNDTSMPYEITIWYREVAYLIKHVCTI